jgi:glycosyltransferase involved in cell wall biosynthesis
VCDLTQCGATPAKHWICCQIGAREHYAVPRSLLRAKQSVELLTDVWASPALKRILPTRWRQRFHPELSDTPTHSWTAAAALLQLRLKGNRWSSWEQITQTNAWFQEKVCRLLPSLVRRHSKPPVVFAYSYAASRILQFAKDLGCQTVLGQIDPGPVEMRIVQSLERQQGTSFTEWPPESYWDDWRVECNLADAIVVNSEWSRSALIAEGVAAEKLHTVPLAYDCLKNIPEVGLRLVPVQFDEQRKLRVLFLGQVIPRKGILELATAIRRMNSEPVEWFLVGGGPESFLNQLRQAPNTIVTGAVSRESAAEYYEKSDVFILPTHSDGFALTQLEAIARGLPLIVSRNCGDVVQDGQNGILLRDVTAESIIESVRRLLTTQGLLRSLSGHAKLQAKFMPDNVGRMMVDIASEATGAHA